MKYIFSALFACVLGTGLAHAQSTGSATTDQGSGAQGTGTSDTGNVDNGNTGDVQQQQGDTGSNSGAAQKRHQHPAGADSGAGSDTATPPSSSSQGSGAGNGAGSSSGSDIYNTPSSQGGAQGGGMQQGAGSSTGGEDQMNKSGSGSSSGTQQQGQQGQIGSSSSGAGSSAGWPANVQMLTLQKGQKIQQTGSFTNAQSITNLSLPASCIGKSDKDKMGNQVLFGAAIPSKGDVTITVTPNDASQKLHVYAYALPQGRFDTPDQASDVAMCKSSFKSATMKGGAEKVRLTGLKADQNLVIGVAGGQDMTAGDFTITVDQK